MRQPECTRTTGRGAWRRLSIALALAAALAGCAGGDTRTSSSGRDSPGRQAAITGTSLGQAYIRQGDYEAALEKIEGAIRSDPRYAPAYSARGLLYERINRADRAGAAYARSVELAPEDGALLNNYGSWLCRNGQPAEADAMFVRALDDPFFRGKLEVLFNAGRCAQGAGELASADGYYRRALELDPAHAPSLSQMARLQVARGDHMRARAFLQRLEAIGPLDATSLELAASIETGLGNAAAAEAYRARLREQFPDHRPSTEQDPATP